MTTSTTAGTGGPFMRRAAALGTMMAIVLVGRVASAHEFICEKTVDGSAMVTIDHYPVTLTYEVTITNVHPTEASIAIGVEDTMSKTDFEVPMTLAVGESVTSTYEVTISSYEECVRLADNTGPNDGV